MRVIVLAAILSAGVAGGAFAQAYPPGPPPGGFPGGRPGMHRGPLFISPMGEPFRGRPDAPAPHDQWFDGADTDHDGALTNAEMQADAARFFKLLDQRGDGEIDPDDVERYETILAPEIRVGGMGGGPPGMRRGGGRGKGRGGPPGGGGGGGPPGGGGGMDGPPGGAPGGGGSGGGAVREVRMKQGAARFGYLDYPQPVIVADRNFNRGVDSDEWAKAADARFAMLDANGDGKLEKSELPKLRSFGPPRGGNAGGGREKILGAD